jgi:uncharacterized RDD family membrane protein YckC
VTNDDSDLPEGPLDPFDDNVPLASGPDDVGFLRTPSAAARLVSSLIDLVVVFFSVVVPATVLPLLILHPVNGKFTTAQSRTITWITLAVVAAVMVAYVALERLTGASPGRRLMRLRLITVSGARPSWARLFLKYAAILVVALVPFVSLPVLLALVYGGIQKERRNGLDLLAGTRVVSLYG